MSVMVKVTDEHKVMIQDCVKRHSRLTEWEIEFISDLQLAVEKGWDFTIRQDSKLDEIWEKATAKG